jgi:predicted SAM-dependent methyltransferase
MKYHLGCGSNYLEGYLNVDFPPENHNVNHDIKADLYTDILKMNYPDCEEIRSHHFFEHFNYFDTCVLLYKWTHNLQLGGILVIDLPDLEALCQAYLLADVKTRFLVGRYMFGSHEANWAYHINMWSQNTLTYILTELGYVIENIHKYGLPTDKQPNCGLTIRAKKNIIYNQEEIKNKITNFLELYKNGDTDFENRLCQYFKDEFNRKI